ncbi:hypothetical protein LEP1GSC169_2742 [Leptospira santarosai str. HAI1349]|nr:hypothetical protein LEP1GSC169_2742 [Leptospira santarosai str. HAI1349]EMP79959.1 hypothetical protein LEP1GSC162_0857 [Leptospira santarosai str. CBC1531]
MKTVCGSSYIRNRLRLFYVELTLIYKLCGFFVYEVVGVSTWAVLGQTQYCFHTSE